MRKRLAYGLLVTSAFFVILEVGLALFSVRPASQHDDPFVGLEHTLPLYVATNVPSSSASRLDSSGLDSATRRTTAPNRLRYFNEQSFLDPKPSGTYRIFCLGGSTTYGRPYDDSTSSAGWLRAYLSLADPSRDYEVINAGGISYASYRIAAMMDELCKYEPDMFIVYTGQNEFLEARTYRGLHRAIASRSRTYTVLRDLLVAPPATPTADEQRTILPAEVKTILDRSIGPHHYERSMLQRSSVVTHFQFNIGRIVAACRSVNAPLVLVKPAVNSRDFAPLKNEHRSGISDHDLAAWNKSYRAGVRCQERKQFAAALVHYRAAAETDGEFAELHYRLGKCFLEIGQDSSAKRAFQRAVDEDVCPLRATTAIVETIEDLARQNSIPLVDFPAILAEQEDRDAGLGSEWFLDHVHPSIDGNRILALALIEAMRQMKAIPAESDSWTDQNIRERASALLADIDTESHAVALRNLAQVLTWAGKHEEAGPLAVMAMNMRDEHRIPEDAETLFYAGVYFSEQNQADDAIATLERLVKLVPKRHDARLRLAQILFDEGQFVAARVHYAVVHSAKQLDDPSRLQYAMTLVKAEQFQQVLSVLEREASCLMSAMSDSAGSHDMMLTLGQAHGGLGDTKKAVEAYRRAIGSKPNSIVARQWLARIHASQNRNSLARQRYQEILKLEPGLDVIRAELDALPGD